MNPRRWWSLVGLCMAAAIVCFALAGLPVATPAIAADLGGSVTALQWANTIFTLMCGALVIAAGRFGDLLGRRKVLDIGLVFFAAASVVAALAPSTAALIAGRALMGIAAAAILPATAYAARFGPAELLIRVDGPTLDVTRGDGPVDLAFAAGPGIRRLISGELAPDRAIATGVVEVLRGHRNLLVRFASTFHLAA